MRAFIAAFSRLISACLELFLALDAEACDKEHLMPTVVVLVKKKGLACAAGNQQEGQPAHAPARNTTVMMDECCVTLTVTQASLVKHTGLSVWPVQLISELISDFGDIVIPSQNRTFFP